VKWSNSVKKFTLQLWYNELPYSNITFASNFSSEASDLISYSNRMKICVFHFSGLKILGGFV